jgi:hypothetical protein
MLKKLLTGCLTIAMVAALSATAMAEVKTTAKTRYYFGQYSVTPSGGDSASSFVTAAEGNVGFMGTVGDITGFMEIEMRTSRDAAVGATQLWTQWTKDALSIKIGKFANVATIGFHGFAGGKTSDLGDYAAPDMDVPVMGYIESDNLHVGYKVGDLNLGLSIYVNGDAVFTKGPTGMAAMTSDGNANGQTTQLTVDGKAGPVVLRIASTSVSLDDPMTAADDDDESNAGSALHLGVMYPMGNMAFSLDYGNNTYKDGPAAGAVDIVNGFTRLGFSMKEAGPGTFTFTYETVATTVDGEAWTTLTQMGLGYDIPMGPGSGVDLLYYSASTAYDASGADAKPESFIGGGFYAFF